MKIVKVKIGDLFSRLNLLNIEYEREHINHDEIFIRTPNGDFSRISAFVRKNAPAIRILTESNKKLIAATNHIIISNNGEEYLKDATKILTIQYDDESNTKFENIVSKEFLGNRDLYDISISSPHLYVDINGFVHHNTTIAKALCNEVGVDYIIINGSLENGIDLLRTKLISFASTISLTDSKKVVIIDEADYLNANSLQPALRNFLEEYSNNCTFILTCNYKDRIISPIHSRCAVIDFKIPNSNKQELAGQFFKHTLNILKQEDVEYDPKVVAELVQKYLPDYRRIINELQRYSVSGKIDTGILINLNKTSLQELFNGMKVKNFTQVRNWVTKNSDSNTDQIFKMLYDHSNDFVQQSSVPQLIVLLADYSYKKSFMADQELNLVACLVEIMASCEFK